MYEIAVIIINYNSSEYTLNCIKSVIEKTRPSLKYQIIVVDNASNHDDYEKLSSEIREINFPYLILVRSRINNGFGGGNMFGANYANSKYIAFLNNDTLLINDCLTLLKNGIEIIEDAGVLGVQAFRENGDFMISFDHFASPIREIIGRSFLETFSPKKHPKRKIQYPSPIKANFVPGSFMFLRTEVFNEIGGFDTNIFLYYEETDLCKRLAKINKYAYLIPSAHFIHYHGASTGKSLAIKKELKISLLYLIRKHYGFCGYLAVKIFLTIKYFFSSIIKPKNWGLFFLILGGGHLSKSMKMKQKIHSK